MKALLIAEARDGRVLDWSYETEVFAARAGAETCMFIVTAAGAVPSYPGTLYLADSQRYGEYDPLAHLRLVLAVVDAEAPDLVVCVNSSYGQDLAPRIAGALQCAQVSDVVAYEEGLFTLPACNAKLRRRVKANTARVVVTLQPGAFDARERTAGEPRVEPLDVGDVDSPYESLGFEEAPSGAADLAREEVIVCAGRGVGKREHMHLVEELASALGAQIGATRPVVDAGWCDRSRQIGVSGVTVSPKLYVACGVSGAVQHLVGIRGAELVVAINTDRHAPIAEAAHVMAVADLVRLLPVLTAKLRSR
jgi:electron transfer flavoprotein alpha subunit